MPSFERHCEECYRVLGEDFPEVHRWMDELFKVHGPRHRRFRHHLAGIEEVRRHWGDRAAQAAVLHIKADLREQGWHDGDHFPRDEQDFVRMGWV